MYCDAQHPRLQITSQTGAIIQSKLKNETRHQTDAIIIWLPLGSGLHETMEENCHDPIRVTGKWTSVTECATHCVSSSTERMIAYVIDGISGSAWNGKHETRKLHLLFARPSSGTDFITKHRITKGLFTGNWKKFIVSWSRVKIEKSCVLFPCIRYRMSVSMGWNYWDKLVCDLHSQFNTYPNQPGRAELNWMEVRKHWWLFCAGSILRRPSRSNLSFRSGSWRRTAVCTRAVKGQQGERSIRTSHKCIHWLSFLSLGACFHKLIQETKKSATSQSNYFSAVVMFVLFHCILVLSRQSRVSHRWFLKSVCQNDAQ